jgi:hypothetical protein
MAEQLYRYTVPETYYCDNHTPGDVLTVRLLGEDDGNPGWFRVETANGDEFPATLDELRALRP